MTTRGHAYFVEWPSVAEDLLIPHLLEQEREYEIVKTITLPRIDYENY